MKLVIYQVFTRLFNLRGGLNKPFGTIEENERMEVCIRWEDEE